MKRTFAFAAVLSALAVFVPQAASACAPPPPGWVAPTRAEQRASFVFHASDVVYGRIEKQGSGMPGLRVYHVYKGARAVGDWLPVSAGYEFPIPYCAGMELPPPAKPLGTYGVFVVKAGTSDPIFVKPDDVQAMIAEGLIRSARAGS